MSDRLSCCVPFCGRTWKGDERAVEWICRSHWTSIRMERRKVYRKAIGAFKADPNDLNRTKAIRLWNAMKREAIEKAAGI
ncbi:hypothetical protein FHT87_005183 [Rhizobium sp. BK316]|uniref:hypothetical protein n=1 Tax=Rhizobium sp. BK316 TaxID=2587053 RepID=UPI001613D2C1|nr:hypothetical protein [Rhizobium sp. BK316]MBB3411230.1 hypothetical protein [Rhizobium sp. BK316]